MATSSLYTSPFDVSAGTTVKAAVFNGRNMVLLPRHATISYDTSAPLQPAGSARTKTGLNWFGSLGAQSHAIATPTLLKQGQSTASTFDLSAIDTALGAHGQNYTAQYNGILTIQTAGTYTFKLTSDDGSRLLIDDVVVIDNDGPHPPTAVKGSVNLAAGSHKFDLRYFQLGGGTDLELTWTGPGFSETALGPGSFTRS